MYIFANSISHIEIKLKNCLTTGRIRKANRVGQILKLF